MFSSTHDFKERRGYKCPDFLASCLACDCSNMSCQQCLQKTCCYCCPQLLTQQKQYPHIVYEQVKNSRESDEFNSFVAESPIKQVPIERIFKQTYTHGSQEFPVHPQIGYTSSEDFDSSSGVSGNIHRVIAEQPRTRKQSLYMQPTMVSEPAEELDHDRLSIEMSSVLQYSLSPHSSLEDLDADLGFIDASSVIPVESMSISSGTTTSSHYKPEIRITRTPDGTLERPRRSMRQSFVDISSLQQPMTRMVTSHSESALHQKASAITRHTSPQYPCVNFALYYDDQHSTLIVHLYQAHKLPTKRSEEASNPFVEVYVLPRKFDIQQSHTASRTLNPVFDQAFKFTNIPVNEVENQTIIFRIYINDKNHFIGGVTFPLEHANMIGDLHIADIIKFDEDEYLRGTSHGDLLLSLCYGTKLSVLEIVVLEANNLKKQDVIGLSNPYVKINLIFEDKRLLKWKTTVKKSTLMPVFNETCQLDLSNLDVRGLQLEILVMDYDRFGRNTEMGRVSLGNDVTHASGQSHWKRVMQVVNKHHSYWHAIKPISSPSFASPSRSRSRTRSRTRSRSPSIQSGVTPVGMQI